MSTNGVFIIAVVVTLCLTFYIVAGAKNTNSAGEAEANFTLLWSIGFLTAALGSGFVGSKAPASPLKDWLWFLFGGMLMSAFAFPIVLFMVDNLSTLSMILATVGNLTLVASGLFVACKQESNLY